MTRSELLEQADSQELTEWSLLFGIQNEEADLRADGLSPEQIADVIAGNVRREHMDGDGQQAVDALMGDEAAAARRAQIMAEMLNEDDEDDED